MSIAFRGSKSERALTYLCPESPWECLKCPPNFVVRVLVVVIVEPPRWLTRCVWAAALLLVAIALLAVLHRAIVLSDPSLMARTGNPAVVVDTAFASYPALTLVHIIPGALFMILGPLQFVRRIRAKHLAFHRWSGRVFFACGLLIGFSALALTFQTSIGGANERAATVLFAIVFLFELTRAFLLIRRRRIALHREWMIRAFAIGLAIATIRPIVGAFFAARQLNPHEFFGIAFWIGFTIHFILGEVWINYTRPMALFRSRLPAGSAVAGMAAAELNGQEAEAARGNVSV